MSVRDIVVQPDEAAKLQMVIDRTRGRESSPTVQAVAAAVPAGKSRRTDAADPNA